MLFTVNANMLMQSGIKRQVRVKNRKSGIKSKTNIEGRRKEDQSTIKSRCTCQDMTIIQK